MYGILPINLLSFTGKFARGRVTLNWSTSNESNNDHFVIERSGDKINFDLVAMVPGAVSSNVIVTYSISDDEPLYGVSYYRLSQVDLDGTSTSQGTIAIENTTGISLSIYPNPASECLFITGVDEEDEVAVKDASGVHGIVRYAVKEIVPGKKGINISDLDTGVYCIHVTNASGNASKSFRFIKR